MFLSSYCSCVLMLPRFSSCFLCLPFHSLRPDIHCTISATFLLIPTLTVRVNWMWCQAKAQDLCAHTTQSVCRAATWLLTLYMRNKHVGPPEPRNVWHVLLLPKPHVMSSHRGSEGENTASTVLYTHEGQPKKIQHKSIRLSIAARERLITYFTPCKLHVKKL